MDWNCVVDQMDNKELKFVHQFLMHHNFENTADAFMVEAAIKGFTDFKADLKTKDEIYEYYFEQIMLSFKNGDWKTFFKLWNLLIPKEAMQTKACKILMLHLHVYFVMLPKRVLLLYWFKAKNTAESNIGDPLATLNPQDVEFEENFMTEIEKNLHDTMEQLRNFLNTTGKELENDTELRPYFALPFIEDPNAEPFLSKIFEQSWTDELTENLLDLLKLYKPQIFTDIKCNDENNKKFPLNYTSASNEPKSDIITEKPVNNNIPIIPNDRNIPIFFDDGETDEQYSLYDNMKYSKKSKSIQTVSMYSSEENVYSTHSTKKNKQLLQCTQELAVTKSHLSRMHSNYERVKIRFHKLHADYYKLMNIARVLTKALEDSIKGQMIDFQDVLESCIKIFPDLFNHNVKDTSQFSSELLLNKSQSDVKTIQSYSLSSSTFVPPKLLDLKKIKLHLINGSIKIKLFLLQALRRKITFSQSGDRDETVHEYISKDLLGLHSKIANYKGKSILPYLLTPQNVVIPHPLQQSIMRLLNALASFRSGRDYLSFDSTVVDMVFKCLNSTSDNNIDTLTCNMMIAMLQKLSLRKQQRIYMIENGLLEWLIRHLHDQCRIMDSYRLEYATALLMNLSLHQTAQKRASVMASVLIATLIDLLLMDHETALPYINGALNSFLANHEINEEAKKMKFLAVLEQFSKCKTGKIREHLDHIMRIHKGEITVKMEDEQMLDNDNEEFDVLESQLDENDPVKNNYGELCGESLLETYYTISPKIVPKKEIITDVVPFAELKPDAINAVQTNQVKHLYRRQELIPQIAEENSSRKLISKIRDVKNKSIDMMEESVKNVLPHLKPQLHAIQLKSSSLKDRQISKRQITNAKWNLADKTSVKKACNESAMYLYENQIAKESSKTIVASSILLEIGSAAESTVTQKISSIASLNIGDGGKITKDSTSETELDTEEAFLARPKLPRTPP